MSTESKFTPAMLSELQSYPLDMKVRLTKQRIREWVRHYGEDGVYVSFSGGKDSSVLLHLVREEFPNIPAVFIDTGLEYSGIRDFVRTFENVVWIKPEKNFKQVCTEYGFPFVSKDVAKKVYECRKTESRGKESYARRQFEGTYITKNGKRPMANITKWKFLLDAPFPISHKCCDVMKKRPAAKYGKETGRVPITAQMADESFLRRRTWIAQGCNAFNAKRPISNPMSFWKEQDVLRYIKEHNLPIASPYGDIIETKNGNLQTTKCDRTGCAFCGFGCHLQKEGKGKFEFLKQEYPTIYAWIMKPESEGGMGYKEKIDWLNKNGNLHIRY